MGCNYFSLSLIPASGTQVLIWQAWFQLWCPLYKISIILVFNGIRSLIKSWNKKPCVLQDEKDPLISKGNSTFLWSSSSLLQRLWLLSDQSRTTCLEVTCAHRLLNSPSFVAAFHFGHCTLPAIWWCFVFCVIGWYKYQFEIPHLLWIMVTFNALWPHVTSLNSYRVSKALIVTCPAEAASCARDCLTRSRHA